MSIIGEESLRVKYEKVMLSNPMVYEARSWGQYMRMSEEEILLLTIVNLAQNNNNLLKTITKFIERSTPVWHVMPAQVKKILESISDVTAAIDPCVELPPTMGPAPAAD